MTTYSATFYLPTPLESDLFLDESVGPEPLLRDEDAWVLAQQREALDEMFWSLSYSKFEDPGLKRRLKRLRRQAKAYPKEPMALLNLAQCYCLTGHLRQVRHTIRRAKKLGLNSLQFSFIDHLEACWLGQGHGHIPLS